MKKIIALSAVFGSLPLAAFASNSIEGVISTISYLLSIILPILITVAVIYFVWSVIQYTLSGDEEAKKKAKDGIIKGLIGLFIIVSFWGIISIVKRTFKVDNVLEGNLVPEVPTAVYPR